MTVYVRWYGKVLEGELLDGERMGMKEVRIPLDGHHPVALFTPGHIYQSAAEIEGSNGKDAKAGLPQPAEPVCLGHGGGECHKNVEEKTFGGPRKSTSTTDPLPSDDRQGIEAFKQANWDHVCNHLRIDMLDEFYQLWRMVMVPSGRVSNEAKTNVDKRCTKCDCWVFTETLGSPDKPEWHCKHGFKPSASCQEQAAYNEECMERDPNQRPAGWMPRHSKTRQPDADEITARPQRDYGSQPTTRNVVQSRKPANPMRCWRCAYLDYDCIGECQEQPLPGEHFCGLHGRARVDPDGEQMDLDHHGGCGFAPRKEAVQLELFN